MFYMFSFTSEPQSLRPQLQSIQCTAAVVLISFEFISLRVPTWRPFCTAAEQNDDLHRCRPHTPQQSAAQRRKVFKTEATVNETTNPVCGAPWQKVYLELKNITWLHNQLPSGQDVVCPVLVLVWPVQVE